MIHRALIRSPRESAKMAIAHTPSHETANQSSFFQTLMLLAV